MMNIWRACSSRAAWLWMSPSCRSLYWCSKGSREEESKAFCCCVAYWCSKGIRKEQSTLLHIDAQKQSKAYCCILMLKREQSTPRISSSHAECFYTAVKVRRQMVSQTYLNCGEFISWIVEINLSIMGAFSMQTVTQKWISCFILLSACSNGLVD